jgi:branched-chain amino acid transport system substrate-binding protein
MKKTAFLVGWLVMMAVSPLLTGMAAAQEPVIVGVLHSEAYPYAEMMKNSFEMALEDINRQGGVNGRPIRLVYGNDQGQREAGIATVRHLVEEQKAVMLVGAYQSSNALSMAMTAERTDRPLLVCTAADDRVTQREYRNVFRLNPPASDYTSGLETFFLEEIRPRSMAIVYENSPYGTGGALRMMWFCREHDIPISRIIPYLKEKAGKKSIGPDYLRRLLTPLQEQPPEVIFMVSYLADAALLLKTIDELGLPSMLCGGAGGFTHYKFVARAGKLAEHVITASLWAPQLRYHGTRDYYQRYLESFSVPPDYHGAEAYSALLIVADALSRAKSMQPADIREALNRTNRMTPFGPVRFRHYKEYQRQNQLPTVVLQIHNGRFDCIYPYQHASAKFTVKPGWRQP